MALDRDEYRSGGEKPTRRRNQPRTTRRASAAPLLTGATREAGGLDAALHELARWDGDRRVLQALDVMNHGRLGAIVDSLSELIDYYALATCTMPPAETYDDLFAVRSYADGVLKNHDVTPQYKEVVVAAGWLSSLLAVAAFDMGEHSTAHIWCADTERLGRDAGHPDLAAWALLTRSMIAFYQGQSRRSANLSTKGQRMVPVGTVVHAKLAAQEMRAAALVGDAARTVNARGNATAAMARLPTKAAGQSGVFSIPLASEPPYTATSLMLLGRFNEAVAATKQVIRTVYQPEARQRGDHPSGYARSLLILGLAQAGTRDLDAAVCAGTAALTESRPAWPTLVLARELDQVLERDFPNAPETRKYHARYLEVAGTAPGSASATRGPRGC